MIGEGCAGSLVPFSWSPFIYWKKQGPFSECPYLRQKSFGDLSALHANMACLAPLWVTGFRLMKLPTCQS